MLDVNTMLTYKDFFHCCLSLNLFSYYNEKTFNIFDFVTQNNSKQ